MKILIKLFSVFALLQLCTISHAQEKTFSLEDVSFLSGHWIGEAFGGIVEEIWSEPSANAMMGMFRIQKNNSDILFEFLLIEKTDTGVQLRFKHIKPNYIEMEENPIVLNLIEAHTNYVHLESQDQSLIAKYNLVRENTLDIEIISTRDGKMNVTPIRMKKKL